jgi:hypothetical protein
MLAVALRATPPESTSSTPPKLTDVPMAEPPLSMICCPPLTAVALAIPPDEGETLATTNCTPPLPICVPLAVPRSYWTPPLLIWVPLVVP